MVATSISGWPEWLRHAATTVIAVGEKQRLKPYDKALQRFKYMEGLDLALATKNAITIISVRQGGCDKPRASAERAENAPGLANCHWWKNRRGPGATAVVSGGEHHESPICAPAAGGDQQRPRHLRRRGWLVNARGRAPRAASQGC
eukprot:scaffold2119_cov264-Pinguiococcus_pyrenoidosus.AAC.22